jgi:alkylated DNA repair dioxygenase AlkB
VVALQPSLFDPDRPVVRSLAARPGERGDVEETRLDLGQGAWLVLVRSWVLGADQLFGELLDTVPWRAAERPMYDRVVAVPRLLAWYGASDPLPHPALAEARAVLNARFRPVLGEALRTVGLCCYRDGRDSVAWHGDTIGRGATEDTVVAILSLGATRRFLLRPRGGGATWRFDLASGDLLVMGGSCQRTFEHAVPKTQRPVRPRISVQFRPVGVR